MKFKCKKSELVNAVINVSLAVSYKSSLVSLEGILMKANNNQLELTGYNLELGITKTIEIDVIESGEIVLNAKLLTDIITKLADEEIYFDCDDKMLTLIKCGESEFNILGINPSEYPEMPTIEKGNNFNISEDILKNMIDKTSFAVALNEQIPIYTGCLFDINQGFLNLVSADGYRLAITKQKINTQDTHYFVVPGKTLNDVSKLLSKLEDKQKEEKLLVDINISNKHIIFDFNGYKVISRLLEGEFLDYKSAIPKDTLTTLKVKTKDFIKSIERVSVIITDRFKSPIKCNLNDGNVNLSCITTIGKVNDNFKTDMEGENVSIGFNNKYMIDALKASESDEVYVKINGPLSPMKVLPLDGDDFVFLVLPVRLKNDN